MVKGERCRPHHHQHQRNLKARREEMEIETPSKEKPRKPIKVKSHERERSQRYPNPIDKLSRSTDLELFFTLTIEEQDTVRKFIELRAKLHG
jgi:hypothetical protein